MKSRLIYSISFLIALFASIGVAFAQPAAAPVQRSENGYFMSPNGELHIMVVYAEIDFDSSYGHLSPVKNPKGTVGWKKGKLPNWKQWAVSKTSSEKGWLTKYFRQASFDQFKVTGDVLDSIITIPLSSIRDKRGKVVETESFANNYYRRAVINKINSITEPKFLFGSELKEFDRWTYNGSGKENTEAPNGKLDLVMIVWRNLHVYGMGEMSGFVTQGNYGNLWGMDTDMYSMFKTESMLPMVVMRHEFSHMLYGGNNFHTAGGGVGTRTFITTAGGYSNMSAADTYSPTWNGWDRERLGWKNPENTYLLNAKCANTGEDVNGELVYGEELCGKGEYILRDFVTTGDVIKIKLPHLPGHVRNQYLWIENHQRLEGMVDHDKVVPKGLFAYVQVGKDKREGRNIFHGVNNYLWPLIAHGNYDFDYNAENKGLYLYQSKANPLTGYNYEVRPIVDLNNDDKIRVTQDVNPKTEHVFPAMLFIEGREVEKDYFTFGQYPMFGTKEMPFRPELHNKIGISYNPAPTPVYSHSGAHPQKDDNRRIYLNGISIEVMRMDSTGDMKLKIRWDDFDIVENVRWCGDILLKEEVNVKRGKSISLDQGYSVQVTKAVQKIDGESVFAEPTILEIDSGATLRLGKFANLWIKSGSSLFIEKGATLEMENNSNINIERGGHLFIEEGAKVQIGKKNSSIFWQDSNTPQGVNPLFKDRIEGLVPKKL